MSYATQGPWWILCASGSHTVSGGTAFRRVESCLCVCNVSILGDDVWRHQHAVVVCENDADREGEYDRLFADSIGKNVHV